MGVVVLEKGRVCWQDVENVNFCALDLLIHYRKESFCSALPGHSPRSWSDKIPLNWLPGAPPNASSGLPTNTLPDYWNAWPISQLFRYTKLPSFSHPLYSFVHFVQSSAHFTNDDLLASLSLHLSLCVYNYRLHLASS